VYSITQFPNYQYQNVILVHQDHLYVQIRVRSAQHTIIPLWKHWPGSIRSILSSAGLLLSSRGEPWVSRGKWSDTDLRLPLPPSESSFSSSSPTGGTSSHLVSASPKEAEEHMDQCTLYILLCTYIMHKAMHV